MMPSVCTRNHSHAFDPVSGWCTNGCGWRQDGAHTWPARRLPSPEHVDFTEPRRPAPEGPSLASPATRTGTTP